MKIEMYFGETVCGTSRDFCQADDLENDVNPYATYQCQPTTSKSCDFLSPQNQNLYQNLEEIREIARPYSPQHEPITEHKPSSKQLQTQGTNFFSIPCYDLFHSIQ